MRKLLPPLAAIVSIGAAAAVAWFALTPGPTAFAKEPRAPLGAHPGPDPTGVPAELRGQSLVQRGEYLTRAADCVVCHTAIGGQPFAGGFAMNLPFGTLYSTNITPDKATGIGRYTDAQFISAVRHGVRADGARLYPAMPYTSYRYMTDNDVLAIKAYLTSLPPVSAPARRNTLGFPFNQRPLLAAWSGLFSREAAFETVPGRGAQWNRGAYLAEALAHCGECHTPRNPAYALDNRRKFAGAIAGGWRAYDISSDRKGGIGAWRTEELAAYLRHGQAPGRGAASGPMGEVADHSLGYLTPSDLLALATYVRSVPAAGSNLPEPQRRPAPASHREGAPAENRKGEQVFAAACASCHDWTGVSPLMSYATLTGARAVNDPNATNVAQVVINGVQRANASATQFMPAFGGSYDNAEVAAVANYVTARFGARGSSLSEDDVARLRRAAAQ
jgi:mono/diheme cytochrome c family protein